jgi:3-deoxy-D-manno-octulosonic-acid transferase
MYVVYSSLLFVSLLFYIIPYFVRIKLFRKESLFIRERLGFSLKNVQSEKKSVWFHAVSVGEVLSLQNLIKKVKESHPDWIIYFSTLTNTGMRVAREKLTDADYIFFVPLDFTCIVRKFFNVLKPTLFVLAESEFWPNLIRVAKKMTRGVLLINGRISSGSFRKHYRYRWLSRRILKNIDMFLVQTENDKKRLERIGVRSEYVKVVSNLKSEIDLPLCGEKKSLNMKKNLNMPFAKKVIVAGSTRKGEERMLLDAFEKASEVRKDLLLILAPRHPERFDEVERICQDSPFRVKRRTQAAADTPWDIMILDTIGELAQFYALCDLAFIGGSLVPWGGHNLLEPAFYQKPIFFGPHMKNFAYLADRFVQADAARVVHTEDDIVEMFMFKDEKSLSLMGNRAKSTLNSLQGATEKTIQAIDDMTGESLKEP